MNQLAYGQKIKIPAGVVRSVSFDKIRSGSLSAREKSDKIQNNTRKNQQHYEQLLAKKLAPTEHRTLRQKRQNITETNHHIQQLRKQLQQKQMKECTFKPKINDNTHKQRTLQEFISQQRNFQKNKRNKVEEMRSMLSAKLDKQNTFQPNIQQQNHDKHNIEVHNRLYEDFRKRNTKQNIINDSIQKSACSKNNKSKKKLETFSQKKVKFNTSNASSHLKQPISSEFSSHTLMSQNSKNITVPHFTQRSQISRQHSQKSLKSQKGLKVTKYMNVQQLCEMKLRGNNSKTGEENDKKNLKRIQKNKQLYVQKVLRQISYILFDFQISGKSLGYLELTRILETMNFINEEQNVENRKYLFQIWQMLQGDVYETVPLINLIKLIFCLLGCHEKSIIENCLKQYFTVEQMTERVLILTEKDSKRIKTNFEQLSLNRFNKGEYIHESHKEQQYTFKPFVSKNSTQMAQKYRQKVIQQSEQLINNQLIDYPIGENGFVDHVDLLMLDEKRKQLKIKMQREIYQRQKIRLEDQIMGNKEGGFKQKRKTLGSVSEQYSINPVSRVQTLYELGKNSLREKQNMHPEQQLSKECTFHPNIAKNRQNSSKNNSRDSSAYISDDLTSRSYRTNTKNQIKDYDKSVFRMYEARRLRDDSHNKLVKKNIEEGDSRKQDDSPLVYLNVSMQGYEEVKVPIFKTDTMRSITHKVRILMNIAQTDQHKLQEILKLQILPALNQMGLNIIKYD